MSVSDDTAVWRVMTSHTYITTGGWKAGDPVATIGDPGGVRGAIRHGGHEMVRAATVIAAALLVAGCNDPEPSEDRRGVDYTIEHLWGDPPGSHPPGVNPLDVLREVSR